MPITVRKKKPVTDYKKDLKIDKNLITTHFHRFSQIFTRFHPVFIPCSWRFHRFSRIFTKGPPWEMPSPSATTSRGLFSTQSRPDSMRFRPRDGLQPILIRRTENGPDVRKPITVHVRKPITVHVGKAGQHWVQRRYK